MSIYSQQNKGAPVLGENWIESFQLIKERQKRSRKTPERFVPGEKGEAASRLQEHRSKRRKCPNGDCGECEDRLFLRQMHNIFAYSTD